MASSASSPSSRKRSSADSDVALSESSSTTAPKRAKTEVGTSRFRYTVVCAANMNRSMNAHALFEASRFRVTSYGASSGVRLPGPGGKPRVFKFGTPYKEIHATLTREGKEWYTRKKVLFMLERNQKIKEAPQRWQDQKTIDTDVVISFDERIFDIIVEDLQDRESVDFRPLHVVSLDIKDDHGSATAGAKIAIELARKCEAAESKEDLEGEMPGIVSTLEEKSGVSVQYSLVYV